MLNHASIAALRMTRYRRLASMLRHDSGLLHVNEAFTLGLETRALAYPAKSIDNTPDEDRS